MTREEATIEACAVFGLAHHSIGDYSKPSDGFCSVCSKFDDGDYQNSGQILEYVRLAVVEKLLKDGFTIVQGFDPVTGREII